MLLLMLARVPLAPVLLLVLRGRPAPCPRHASRTCSPSSRRLHSLLQRWGRGGATTLVEAAALRCYAVVAQQLEGQARLEGEGVQQQPREESSTPPRGGWALEATLRGGPLQHAVRVARRTRTRRRRRRRRGVMEGGTSPPPLPLLPRQAAAPPLRRRPSTGGEVAARAVDSEALLLLLLVLAPLLLPLRLAALPRPVWGAATAHWLSPQRLPPGWGVAATRVPLRM